MSDTDDLKEAATAVKCCASCGVAEVDEIKLKKCDDCDLVRYCSDKCKEDHRADHEAKCKERAAVLHDELLFRQPESTHLGDCPICCLPLNPMTREFVLMGCCSKLICNGCSHASDIHEFEERLEPTCPFCRHPVTNEEDADISNMKRVAANDPLAIRKLGVKHHYNEDYAAAIRCYRRAAELGDVDSHIAQAHMYQEGLGVRRDKKKVLHHWEKAAIAGDPHSRHLLGVHEESERRFGRAVKHFIIAANLGNDDSIQALKTLYKDGKVSKEDFAAALRGHHAAINAMKSPQRDAAARSPDFW